MLHQSRAWLREQGLHRQAIYLSERFFRDAPGYVLGDMELINRLARAFEVLAGAVSLPEWEAPLTGSLAVKIAIASNGG